jgi:hypothetical protein
MLCLAVCASIRLHLLAIVLTPRVSLPIGLFASIISITLWPSLFSIFNCLFMSEMNCDLGSGLSTPLWRTTANCCAYAVVGPACLIALCVTRYAGIMVTLNQCARMNVPLHLPCPVSSLMLSSTLPDQLLVITVQVPPGL